jgi:hypothetical protein
MSQGLATKAKRFRRFPCFASWSVRQTCNMEIPLHSDQLDGLAVLAVMLWPREDPHPRMERWRAAALKAAALAADQELGGGLAAYLESLGAAPAAQLVQAPSIESCYPVEPAHRPVQWRVGRRRDVPASSDHGGARTRAQIG